MDYFQGIFRNIRFYVLVFSSVLAGFIYFYVKHTLSDSNSQIIEFTQLYALTAVTFLYFTMLAAPLTKFFPFIPFQKEYLKSRRALGVSSFLFALLHSYYAFFGELGGFAGLQFLNIRYLTAVTLGATSLTFLTFLFISSFDLIIAKIAARKWTYLNKIIYVVALFIIIHALMLGSHFADLSGSIPQIFSLALVFLLFLEALRFDGYLNTKFKSLPKIGISVFVISLFAVFFFLNSFFPTDTNSSLSLHEAHKKLAAEAQSDLPAYLKNLPGMQGDKTKRFTVDFDVPESIKANQPAVLKFRVFDAASGDPVNFFSLNYTKLMHLIIVDSSLNSYQHLHPEYKDGWFQLPVTFPKDDRYHIYLDFVPTGAIEQQFGLTVGVGNPASLVPIEASVDESPKQSGDYQVKINYNSPLLGSLLSVGGQNIDFEISDKNGNPVTTLKPYLGSFGHMVMLNTKTFEYTHVHPYQIGNLQPDQNGGPKVTFMPVGIYGPIKPGTYKIFAQFNPDNNLITTDFTVKVQ